MRKLCYEKTLLSPFASRTAQVHNKIKRLYLEAKFVSLTAEYVNFSLRLSFDSSANVVYTLR
jgi:hypothetical protein